MEQMSEGETRLQDGMVVYGLLACLAQEMMAPVVKGSFEAMNGAHKKRAESAIV